MKYLNNRNQFLSKKVKLDSSKTEEYYKGSKIVKEAFENDATWGGSLLGRLINSTIRKAKIYYKATKINKLVDEVRSELDKLMSKASTTKDQKNDIESLTARFLLDDLFKTVTNDDSVDKKLTSLIGDGKRDDVGILNKTIKEVEKLKEDVLAGKDDLLEKLEDFRDALKDIDFEPEESDEDEDEDEESDESDASKMSESDLNKKPEFNFYWQTTQLFKSLIALNNVILSKKVVLETSPELEVGKEFLHTNQKGQKNPVKILSLSNSLGIGTDKKWLTKDDVKKGNLAKDAVLVQFKDKTGQYTSASPVIAVSKTNLSDLKSASFKESQYFENEELPILENLEVIRKSETQATAAWKKILAASKNSNLAETAKLLQEIINLSKSGDKLDKSVIIAIGKNILLNETTTGKPIGIDALIKEEAGVIPAKYTNVAKNISLISRILISLKEDTGLIGSFGEAAKPIKDYITAYSQLKEILPKLPKKEIVKESNKNIYDFNRFRIFEAIDKTKDEIVKAWYQFFKEGEEKEWTIDEKRAKELQETIAKNVEEEYPVGIEDNKDNIIRIINLFGKAYRLYATDEIPSGRPEGRISQKTFREYTYIGDDKSIPEWKATSSPGRGPWAAKVVFEKWENGIMGILEDPKYRKILANAKFLPKGVSPLGSGETGSERGYSSDKGAVEKAIRAGRSLLDFINDLLSGEGEFRKTRKKIIKEYFGGADDIDTETKKEVQKGSLINPSKNEKGEKNELSFASYGLMKRTDSQNIDMKKFTKANEYGREFFRIKYKDGHLIGFIMGKVDGVREGLVVKFHFSKEGKKQSVVSNYLSDKINKGEYKLFSEITKDDTLPLNVGVFNITKTPKFIIGKEITLKYAQIIGRDTVGEVKEITFKPTEISSLAYFDDTKWEAVKIDGAPDKYLAKDITSLDKIKPNIKDFGIE